MSHSTLVRAATLDRICDVVDDLECVSLRHLPSFTTLLVQTVNSLYRVVVTPGPDVCVQGGAFFPAATAACVDGASSGGSLLKVGCICVGLRVEIRAGLLRVITSPVRAIAVVQASGSAVH